MNLSDKEELIQYLKSHGLWAKKGLGQNFLVDKKALQKIVESAEIKKDDLVIEVGPGTGVLTRELVKAAGEVVAVEMDKKLADLLKNVISTGVEKSFDKLKTSSSNKRSLDSARDDKGVVWNDNLKVINGDILKVNLDEIIGDRRHKVVANIPYYITSKILELFLSRKNKPESIVLLVQKEVAERICAKAGGMSVLSLSVQLYGDPEIVGIVPAASFFPAPKVDSAIIRINNIKASILGEVDEKSFFRLVHIGFASRRKTLVNNLSAGYHIDKNLAGDIIKEVGLKETVRAQELKIEDWKRLARNMGKSCSNTDQ